MCQDHNCSRHPQGPGYIWGLVPLVTTDRAVQPTNKLKVGPACTWSGAGVSLDASFRLSPSTRLPVPGSQVAAGLKRLKPCQDDPSHAPRGGEGTMP